MGFTRFISSLFNLLTRFFIESVSKVRSSVKVLIRIPRPLKIPVFSSSFWLELFLFHRQQGRSLIQAVEPRCNVYIHLSASLSPG